MADQDTVDGGEVDFDGLMADFMNTDGQPVEDEAVPVMDSAPTTLAAPPEAVAEAAAEAKKPRGRKTKAAEATVLAEPAEDEADLDALPESTRLEMAAGRAALETHSR